MVNIENLAIKLKEQLEDQSKDKKIDYLEDLIVQKDAKIKLYDSRIKILQVYLMKKTGGVSY